MANELDLPAIEKLLQLITLHKIDYIEVAGIKVQKTRHDVSPQFNRQDNPFDDPDMFPQD